MHAARRDEHRGQEREHREHFDRELDVGVRGERTRVAKHQHERRETEQHTEHADIAGESRRADEEIEDDEDEQQPLDLGDGAAETAELRLLDLETTLDGIATHGARLTAACGRVERHCTELTAIDS